MLIKALLSAEDHGRRTDPPAAARCRRRCVRLKHSAAWMTDASTPRSNSAALRWPCPTSLGRPWSRAMTHAGGELVLIVSVALSFSQTSAWCIAPACSAQGANCP
jgi:hypothetical protein